MALPDEPIECECGAAVEPTEATRTKSYGDLDPSTWQALCCPNCGRKLTTVFVGDE